MNSTAPGNGTVFRSMFYKEPLGLNIFRQFLLITLAVLGVLGNMLVVVVITKRANMKTTMNLYLRNLAIADLGVLLVNFPLTVVAENTPRYPFGKHFCLFISPATEIFYGASIWSIAVIALERYRNIISRRSFAKRPESTRKITLKILAIWVISFVVVAVPMYPIMVYTETMHSISCYPDWPHTMIVPYTVGMAAFWYLLPLGIISFTYIKISRRLVKSTRFHKEMHGDDFTKSKLIKQEEKQRLKQNKKAQRILTPLVVVFAFSMLPLTLFRLTFAFYPPFLNYEFCNLLFSVCAFFVVLNSAADPIVYYISSKEFRSVLGALMCKGAGAMSAESTHVGSQGDNTMSSLAQTKC